jgi:rhamnogalacturonan endolyase
LQTLRADASKYADANFDADFYDSIAQYVPNYVPTSGRGTWKGNITLPKGATRPLAVLSPSGLDFQDSNLKPTGYQYWADIAADGTVTIPRVKAGDYRLTVYADGIFGQYVQDNIHVSAGSTQNTVATWAAESAGTELWRIGTPDKSSGDFRHGNERDTTRTRRPRQYRLYWAVHDFPTDFPNGVNFTIGRDDIQKGLNYVHWNVFGGKGNSIRKEVYTKNVNEWKLFFDLDSAAIANKTTATFTVQLAGAKTSAGNNDGGSQDLANLPYTVTVNGKALPVWTIPYVLPLSSVSIVPVDRLVY